MELPVLWKELLIADEKSDVAHISKATISILCSETKTTAQDIEVFLRNYECNCFLLAMQPKNWMAKCGEIRDLKTKQQRPPTHIQLSKG